MTPFLVSEYVGLVFPRIEKMYLQHEREDVQFPLGNWKIGMGYKLFNY